MLAWPRAAAGPPPPAQRGMAGMRGSSGGREGAHVRHCARAWLPSGQAALRPSPAQEAARPPARPAARSPCTKSWGPTVANVRTGKCSDGTSTRQVGQQWRSQWPSARDPCYPEGGWLAVCRGCAQRNRWLGPAMSYSATTMRQRACLLYGMSSLPSSRAHIKAPLACFMLLLLLCASEGEVAVSPFGGGAPSRSVCPRHPALPV